MNQIAQSISSLKAYFAWCSGQSIQSGMDVTNFVNLSSECSIALAQFSSINNGIQSLQSKWQQASELFLMSESPVLSLLLKGLLAQSKVLIATATTIKSQSEMLETQVNAQINNLQQSIQNEQSQYNQAQTDYNNAVKQYNNAQSQLSGSSGFLNGFITGITLGIDNKVKQEEDAASDAQANAQNSMLRSQQAITKIQNGQNVLNTCNNILSELNDLIVSATDLQNTINSTYDSSQQAATDAQNAGGANSTLVALTFIKLANVAVNNLLNIGNEMNAAINW